MCGIISATSFDGASVNDKVRAQFKKQKLRGTEGFGLYDANTDRLVRAPKGKQVFRYLKSTPSTNLLFHHRLPTSIENIKRACHPFSTGKMFETCYILVHNGHITNAYDLIEDHAARGIRYHSEHPEGDFNDSEALLWDFALWQEGKQDSMRTIGNVAFICLAIRPGRKHNRLYFYRNSNPIKMLRNKHLLMLSSEGEGVDVEPDQLYTYDYVSKSLKTKPLELPLYVASRAVTPYVGGKYPSSQYDDDNELGHWDDSRGAWVNDDHYDEADYAEESWIFEEAEKLLLIATPDQSIRQKDAVAVYNRYMWRAHGNYMEAYNEMLDDRDLLKEYLALADRYKIESPNALYTLALYKEASAKIYNDPKYKGSESVNKDYVVSKRQGVMTWD